jgi:hypothetical protein
MVSILQEQERMSILFVKWIDSLCINSVPLHKVNFCQKKVINDQDFFYEGATE